MQPPQVVTPPSEWPLRREEVAAADATGVLVPPASALAQGPDPAGGGGRLPVAPRLPVALPGGAVFSREPQRQKGSCYSALGSAEQEGGRHLRGVGWNLSGRGGRLVLMGTLRPTWLTLVTAGFHGFRTPWVAVCTLVTLGHREWPRRACDRRLPLSHQGWRSRYERAQVAELGGADSCAGGSATVAPLTGCKEDGTPRSLQWGDAGLQPMCTCPKVSGVAPRPSHPHGGAQALGFSGDALGEGSAPAEARAAGSCRLLPGLS